MEVPPSDGSTNDLNKFGSENRIDQRMPLKPDHGLLFSFRKVLVQNRSAMVGPKTNTVVQIGFLEREFICGNQEGLPQSVYILLTGYARAYPVFV